MVETPDLSSWLTREALAALPEALVLREVRYGIGRPGFRTRQVTPVTTRLDAEVYRVADLADLYRQRWEVETSLAHLKTTMQMEVLHGQTVPGVLKALTVFALGLQPGLAAAAVRKPTVRALRLDDA